MGTKKFVGLPRVGRLVAERGFEVEVAVPSSAKELDEFVEQLPLQTQDHAVQAAILDQLQKVAKGQCDTTGVADGMRSAMRISQKRHWQVPHDYWNQFDQPCMERISLDARWAIYQFFRKRLDRSYKDLTKDRIRSCCPKLGEEYVEEVVRWRDRVAAKERRFFKKLAADRKRTEGVNDG